MPWYNLVGRVHSPWKKTKFIIGPLGGGKCTVGGEGKIRRKTERISRRRRVSKLGGRKGKRVTKGKRDPGKDREGRLKIF